MLLTSCIYKGIRNPYTAYELKRYSLAANLFINEYNSSNTVSKKAEIAYFIADCYDYMGKYDLSKQWFKKSYDLEKSNKTLLAYAYALKKNEQYQDAMDAFAELNNEIQGMPVFRKEANLCKLAKEIKKNKNPNFEYLIERLSASTEANEYSPVYGIQDLLYFSSDRIGSQGVKKYDWSGYFYSDIYQINSNGAIFNLSNINTKDNEGSCCFNSKFNEIYFTRCSNLNVGSYYCQIYSKFLNFSNNEAELLDLGGGISNTIHPALHYSDSILIYSSDRENGKGKYDLYISYKRDDRWTVGQNLSENINTEGNEKFPVWYKDTLYFSSDYLPGFGGLDLFKTWRLSKDVWSAPQRLDYPINSGADDFSYCINPNFIRSDSIVEKAVFSSNRNQKYGDDLFSVIKIQLQPKIEARDYTTSYQLVLRYFKIKPYDGSISDKEILDSVTIEMNSELITTGHSNSAIIYSGPNQHIKLRSGRRGYLNHDIEVKFDSVFNLASDTIIKKELDIGLVPVQFNKEYLLKNVYYDLDKFDIREDAKPALDELYQLMITNPAIRVLISSHTDCRADFEYNLNLSKLRAKSAGEYLISKGILPERIEYKGFGESAPVLRCKCEECSDQQHQINRRSGFQIIK